ncbi:hypothetical protein MNBD_ALPHA06-6 [hydrothermal vent metagenome]|uniref:DUF1203 domain-containing protein n=1 Tax=hydrothermal vent metagenome TaxID=652676 RepID=A0A3B0RIJ2_9ZZZZ
MAFVVSGLPVAEFLPLFEMDDARLKALGILRIKVDKNPGFPCRVTLQEAALGETVLLMNFTHHAVQTPFRSSYAIYIRESAQRTACLQNRLPEVFDNRCLSLRVFDANGMLIKGVLATEGLVVQNIETIFENPDAAYIHAHNAAYGCFAAKIVPASL